MKIKYVKPSIALFFSILLFNILPGLYIYYTKEYEPLYSDISTSEYEKATKLYIWIVLLFTSITYFSLVFFKKFVFHSKKNFEVLLPIKAFTNNQIVAKNKHQTYFYYIKNRRNIEKLGYIACFFVFIYFITGGYEKILAYGTGMDAWEFRIIGYGDRSAALTAILELSRKIFLPFACLYFLNYNSIKSKPIGFKNYFFLFCLLLGGIMTFDRAPILLFFVLIIFKKYSLGASVVKTVILPLILFFGVILIAGITTFIQYNITEFSFFTVFDTGIRFFLHRTIVVPSIASIQLSFHLFPFGSDKLNLEFSRLGALFGKDYISIRTDDVSIFVSPVGFIADIWRNLGLIGCLVTSLFLGYYFAVLDFMIEKLDSLSKIAVSFTSISLCFYFIFGVFFSQGVFAQLFFLIFIVFWLRQDGKKFILEG